MTRRAFGETFETGDPVNQTLKRFVDKSFVSILPMLPLRPRIVLAYLKSYRRLSSFKHPKLYSERMQARKLSGVDFTPLIDKIEAKKFAAGRCGSDVVIPTFYAGDTLPPRDECNWPFPYVIKTTHASGGNIFVRSPPDWDEVEQTVDRFLAHRHSRVSGEVFYDKIKPRVLVEPMIGNGDLPEDYKFFVAGDRVHFVQVDQDRATDHRRVFYSPKWERLDLRDDKPVGRDQPKPANLAKMVEIATKLGRNLGFARVDLYNIDGQIYFGGNHSDPGSGLREVLSLALG